MFRTWDGRPIKTEDPVDQRPSVWDTVKAFAQEETYFAFTKDLFPSNIRPQMPEGDKTTLLDWINENEEFSIKDKSFLLRSRTTKELQDNLRILEETKRNDEVLMNASGASSVAALGVLMVADPLNLIPAGWFHGLRKSKKAKALGMGPPTLKAVEGSKFATRGAVIAGSIGAAEESIIHANNPNRSLSESLLTIGGVSAIGYGLGKVMDRRSLQSKAFNQKIKNSLQVLEDKGELPARLTFDDSPVDAFGIEQFAAFTAPVVRLLTSPSQALRSHATELLTTSFYTKRSKALKAAPVALESRISASWADYSEYIGSLESEWVKHVTGKSGGPIRKIGTEMKTKVTGLPEGRLSFREFDALVTRYRAGAVKNVPDEVKNAARSLDAFYKKWEKEASSIWESGSEAIPNYLNRRWNAAYIAQHPEEAVDFLFDQWRKNDPDYLINDEPKMREIFKSFVKKISSSPSERIVIDEIYDETVRGSTKMRYFQFIDEADLYNTDLVLHSSKDATSMYTKSVIADVLFHKHYGTLSTKEVMKNIRADIMKEFEYRRNWRNFYPDLAEDENFSIIYEGAREEIGKGLRPHRDPNAPLPSATTRTNPDGTRTIYIDRVAAKEAFNRKAWTNPKVKGVTPLDSENFKTPEDWEDFILFHELEHIRQGPMEGKRTSKSIADRENAANKAAIESLKKAKERELQEYGESKHVLSRKEFDLLNKEIELLEAMIGRVRGTYMSPHSPLPGSVANRSIDALMKFNNLRLGGGFLLSSFVDVGRPAMHMGLKRAYGPVFKAFLTQNKEVMAQMGKASQELKAWAIGNELHYSQRLSSMLDQVPTTSPVTAAERALGEANDNFFIINGLSIWNEYMKKNTGIAVMDRIISSAQDARANKISKKDLEALSQMGLDKNHLLRIADEFDSHGSTVEGVRVTDYLSWQDQDVADLLFEAVRKEVDTIIVTPGVGDTPLIMSNQFVAMVAQYKTFALAATTKMMLRSLQAPDANMVNGMLVSILAGASVSAYKDYLSGRNSSWSDNLLDGIDRSGWMASIGEGNSIISNTPLGNLAITGHAERAEFDDFAFGPTAGAFTDSMNIIRGLSGGGLDSRFTKSLWNLTPYHNLFYITNLLSLIGGGS